MFPFAHNVKPCLTVGAQAIIPKKRKEIISLSSFVIHHTFLELKNLLVRQKNITVRAIFW